MNYNNTIAGNIPNRQQNPRTGIEKANKINSDKERKDISTIIMINQIIRLTVV
jgi:hypothetical protein